MAEAVFYGIYVSQDMGETWEFRCCGPQPGGEPSEEESKSYGLVSTED